MRIVLAAAAGYLMSALVVMLGTAVAAMVAGPAAAAAPTTVLLSVNVAINFAAAVLAGYVCARLAPEGRLTLSVALLTVVFLAVPVITARMIGGATQPRASIALMALLDLIGLWAGAMTERAIHARTPPLPRAS